MIELSAVQNLIAFWWYDYDQGDFGAWPRYFTSDAHFSCRSDSGQTAFEEFIRADVAGADEVLAWQEEHRRNSPYPLRHNGTNVHITERDGDSAHFRSYIFVTQIVGGAVSNLASGICAGTVRREGDVVRFADMRIVLDFADSDVFTSVQKHDPA